MGKPCEDLLNSYDFLFTESQLSSEMAGMGVVAVDFVNRRGSASTDWNYWTFDGDYEYPEIINENVHPDDRDTIKKRIKDIYEGRVEKPGEAIFRVKNYDGQWIWILHKGSVICRNTDGKTRLYMGIETDITLFRDTEDSLRKQKIETESRASEAENLLKAGAVITSSLNVDETVSLILDHIKKVIPYERASVQILNKNELKIIGGSGYKDVSKIIGMEFPYPGEDSLSTKAIDDRKPVICSNLKKNFPNFHDPDKNSPTLSWLGIPLVFRGEVIGLLALDHTEEHFYQDKHLKLAAGFATFVAVALANAREHQKTHKMAMEDVLMKIGTRYSFEMQGIVVFSNAQRKKSTVSLAMADIDHFKNINDTYGHNVGDMVLREIGMICRREFRVSDITARYGGEEIIFLFSDLDLQGAEAVMERLRTTISNHDYGVVKNRISISVGICSKTLERCDVLETMIETADRMLYKAKESGRDRIVSCFLKD